MESFVVSARKYRPLGFEEVVGQGHITTTLKNAIEQTDPVQSARNRNVSAQKDARHPPFLAAI